jgi:transposase
LGRSRGGVGTKLHVRTDQTGKLITWTVTAGQVAERAQVQSLLDQGQIGRRRKPKRVAADKGYTGRPVRGLLRRRKIGAVIPRFSTERRRGVRFDREAYKLRNVVERSINRLKQYRGIATRYDKLAWMFHAGITVVALVQFWL